MKEKYRKLPLRSGVGVVLLNNNNQIEKVITKFSKNKKLKGYILDLRNNPGGLLSQAVRISDFFLENGEIVSTKGRKK